MDHRKFGYKLGRNRRERDALFRSQIRSIFEKSGIETTYAKAKAVRGLVEHVAHIIATKDSVTSSRLLATYIQDKTLVSQIIISFKSAFADQTANFTRILKTRIRQGDDAVMAKISFTKPYTLTEVVKEEKNVEKKAVKKTTVKKLSEAKSARSGKAK